MRRIKIWSLAFIVGGLMAAGNAWTADAPITGSVPGRAHDFNQSEIARGNTLPANDVAKDPRPGTCSR